MEKQKEKDVLFGKLIEYYIVDNNKEESYPLTKNQLNAEIDNLLEKFLLKGKTKQRTLKSG